MATIEKTLERLNVIENAFEDIKYDIQKLCYELELNIEHIEDEDLFLEKAINEFSDAMEHLENIEDEKSKKEKNVYLENYKAWSDVESVEDLYNHFENLTSKLYLRVTDLITNTITLQIALKKAEVEDS